MAQFKKFSKILVAIDGSPNSMQAADYGIAMAKKDNADLVIITIIQTPLHALTFYGESSFKQFVKKSKNEAEEWFGKIRKKASEDGVSIKTEVIEKTEPIPFTIVNYAEDKKMDLIVIGSRGGTSFKKILLGSVAREVVTYATTPVIVIK